MSDVKASDRRDDSIFWLVKTSDRILGPFQTSDIEARIRSREIALIDELARPESRWRYVREEELFRNAVEDARRGMMNSREDTEIQGYANTATETISLQGVDIASGAVSIGRSGDAGALDGQSHEPDSGERSITRTSVTKTKSDVTAAGGGAAQAKPAADEEPKQYTFSEQEEAARPSSGSSAKIWILAAAVVLLAAYVVLLRGNGGDSGTRVARSSSPKVEADHAWRVGDFSRALKLYTTVFQSEPNSPEIAARLVPLLIQVDGQTVEAKRVLSAATAASEVDREIDLGLSALSVDETADAETHFRTALVSSPGSFLATFDLGATAFISKSYDDAARRFLMATSAQGSDEAASMAMFARSVLAADIVKSQDRKAAEKALGDLLAGHLSFRQEALLVGASSDADIGDKINATSRLKLALDTDPDQTADHWHDPRLYLEPLHWKSLLPICRKLNDQLHVELSRAFLAYCLVKAGDMTTADRVLSQGLAAAPGDPLLQSVAAYIYFLAKRDDDARAAISLAMRSEIPLLGSYVRARLCERTGDKSCAEQSWRTIAAEVPNSPAALVGLARAMRDDRPKAEELLRHAIELAPSYVPALLLRDELGLSSP